jgi:hypothetical protein
MLLFVAASQVKWIKILSFELSLPEGRKEINIGSFWQDICIYLQSNLSTPLEISTFNLIYKNKDGNGLSGNLFYMIPRCCIFLESFPADPEYRHCRAGRIKNSFYTEHII